mgnify:CR=1 FL=1
MVLLVVAGEPWQKEGTRAISSAEDRYALTAAAVGDEARGGCRVLDRMHRGVLVVHFDFMNVPK